VRCVVWGEMDMDKDERGERAMKSIRQVRAQSSRGDIIIERNRALSAWSYG
jgi:hypothetical protein